jgi:5-methylcytosine-specific restriction endonuclease McrA
MASTTKQIECRNPQCSNMFTPKNAQHGFCSPACRKAARGAQWTMIRKAALRRDAHTCQDCSKTDCRLEVHHLVPLCKGGDNRLTNLKTLCVPCHRRRHRTWRQLTITEAPNAIRRGTDREGTYAA